MSGTHSSLAAGPGVSDFPYRPGIDRAAVPALTAAVLEKLTGGCAEHGIELLPAHQPVRQVLPPGFVQDLWVTGLHVRILLGNAQTNDTFAVAEITAHRGDFVPPHTHDPEDEMFCVLHGEVEFDLPGGPVTAQAGTLVHIPRGVFHGFRNASGADAKVLDLHTPGGFEDLFAEAGTAWPDQSVSPPPGAWNDIERFVSIARARGMELKA